MIFLTLTSTGYAAQLAIVLDDFGYRPTSEIKALSLSPAISVAVLPDSPHAHSIAEKAHQTGHDILIHLPMEPHAKQPLEKDTLVASMDEAEIKRIILNAIRKVPYATGVNNHMGSAMTESLSGMQKVMAVLAEHHYFFLDSKTTAKSQAPEAALESNVPILVRNIFLDDVIQEEDIRHQFMRALEYARANGVAIAIGHPHPQTVRVLEQELAKLPDDIQLVSITSLLPSTLFDRRLLNYCEAKEPIKPTGLMSLFELF